MSEHLEYLVRSGDQAGHPSGDPELVLARAAMSERQTELLTALVGGGPVPAGFDREQVRTQTRGLAAKRRDTVARVAPELERILGADYGPLFLRYAQQGPPAGGYRADSRAFAEWVVRTHEGAAWLPELERWLRPPDTVPPQRRRFFRR